MSENEQESDKNEDLGEIKTRNRLSKKQKLFLTTAKANKGNVTECCTAARIGRSTFYAWLKSSPKFKAAVEEIEEEKLDLSESKLFENIEGGDQKAIQYHLDSKGQARGYGRPKTLEIGGRDGEPLDTVFTVNLVKPKDEAA